MKTESIPFFISTAKGDISAIVMLPTTGELGTPIMIIPGGVNPRARDPVVPGAARRLAGSGRPILQIDHVGSGTTPLADVDGKDQLLQEVCERYVELCNADSVALIGTCAGAQSALAIAKGAGSVTEILAISCPFLHRGGSMRKVRAGVAAIDPLGKTLVRSLAGGREQPTTVPTDGSKRIAALREITPRVKLNFLYGEHDGFLKDFEWLTGSGVLPPEITQQWNSEVIPGVGLYGYSSVQDMKTYEDVLVRTMGDSVRS